MPKGTVFEFKFEKAPSDVRKLAMQLGDSLADGKPLVCQSFDVVEDLLERYRLELPRNTPHVPCPNVVYEVEGLPADRLHVALNVGRLVQIVIRGSTDGCGDKPMEPNLRVGGHQDSIVIRFTHHEDDMPVCGDEIHYRSCTDFGSLRIDFAGHQISVSPSLNAGFYAAASACKETGMRLVPTQLGLQYNAHQLSMHELDRAQSVASIEGKQVFLEPVRSLPTFYALSLFGEDPKEIPRSERVVNGVALTRQQVIEANDRLNKQILCDIKKRAGIVGWASLLHCNMCTMVVDAHTTKECIKKFIRSARTCNGHEFFRTCATCDKVVAGKIVRCGACAETVCMECLGDAYDGDRMRLQCPRCNIATVSYAIDELPRFGMQLDLGVLERGQKLFAKKHCQGARCARCKGECIADVVCGCAICTRYCSEACREADLDRHRSSCTLVPGNASACTIAGRGGLGVFVMPRAIMEKFACQQYFASLEYVMLINASLARRATAALTFADA